MQDIFQKEILVNIEDAVERRWSLKWSYFPLSELI